MTHQYKQDLAGKYHRYQIATAIAILFHGVGLVGLLFVDKGLFERSTPLHLLLMLSLVFWTQVEKNKGFFLFFISSFFAGLVIEIIGVGSGAVFGHYHYGTALGWRVMDTPLVLGVNWFLVLFCSGTCVYSLVEKSANATLKACTVIVGGAFLSVFFDWLMEPVAVKLDFWTWDGGGGIPAYNYWCWLMLSVLLLSLFYWLRFNKLNKFAVNLMGIQIIFFLVLRIFLKS